MSDFKDSAIKLFGQTIPLPLCYHPLFFSASPHQNHHLTNLTESSEKEEDSMTTTTSSSSSGGNKKPKTCSAEAAEIESILERSPKKVGDEEGNGKENNLLKKPDKILACPRCNSTDTKFCYYNNYNANQPRHFCKKCQRYWTAGGTMRNVPVGAGRRKNKNATAAHFRHLMLAKSLREAQVQAAIHGVENPYSGTNNSSSVLNFGCESVAEQGLVISCGKQTRTGFPVSFYPWSIPTYLGKHSREGGIKEQSSANVLVPKFPNRDGLFKGFLQPKTDDRSIHTAEKSLLFLQANPAALCRSQNFQESN